MKNKLKFLIGMSLKRKIKTKWFVLANIFLAILIIGVANIDHIITFFGGDFDKAIAYHNSAVGGNTYSHFGVGVTRGTDFNGEYALIFLKFL